MLRSGFRRDCGEAAAAARDDLRGLGRRRVQGVQHVIWLTLRAANKPYRPINEVIHGASARHPWMTVLDWNGYPRNVPPGSRRTASTSAHWDQLDLTHPIHVDEIEEMESPRICEGFL